MVLVTGATGFVGKPLVEKLFSMNYRVRTISRNKKQLEGVFNEGVEIMQCDISNNEELERALTGVDIAYYLVHSMEGKSSQWEDFAEKDRQIAKKFSDVSKKCNVKRIIYLGGLAHGTDSEMSEHMRSRKDVGKIALAMTPAAPDRLYALIETGDGVPYQGKDTESGELWRSDDNGKTFKLFLNFYSASFFFCQKELYLP